MLSQLSSEIAGQPLEPEKLYDAVDLILSLQVQLLNNEGIVRNIKMKLFMSCIHIL